VRTPGTLDVETRHTDLLSRYPDFEAELRLAHRCATQAPAVMRGESDPLEVLFGAEAASWTERLYRESPLARFYNDLVAGTARELAGRLVQQRPVHVLEIGAGTGGTTAHVLPMLPASRMEYVFTDVSKLFVAQAAHKFRQYSFVHYRDLDVEQEPAAQGFADGQFDLVLAANVLHATRDLRRSLRTARRLLAPGGVLILLEGTGPRRLLDLIFGLTEGWWRFADLELRPQYPLLSPSAWVRLLAEEGFVESAVFPAPDAGLPDPDQAVILVRAPGALTGEASQPSRAQPSATQQPSLISRGAAPLGPGGELVGATAAWQQLTQQQAQLGAYLIDLDPRQSWERQQACLAEALAQPDECSLVVYRDSQRYIPAAPAQGNRAPTNGSAKTMVFDREALRRASPEEQRGRIGDYLRKELRSVLGLELTPADLDRPPQAFGLDSLMGIQLRNRVETDLGLSLSVVDFLKGLTLNQIIDKMATAFAESGPGPTTAPAPRTSPPANLTSEKVDQLSEEALNALLNSLLAPVPCGK
jgi:SAM-dependent methyltransferase